MSKPIISFLGLARLFNVDDQSTELTLKIRQSEAKLDIVDNELEMAKKLTELGTLKSTAIDEGVKVHNKIQGLKFD